MIPDYVLKQFGLRLALKLSKRIKARRNRLRRFFSKLFKISLSYFNVMPKRDRKTYDMKNQEKPLPGELVLIEDSVPTNDLAVDSAHIYAGVVHSFYKKLFNRESLDNNGMQLISSAHLGENYNNAYWNGEQMAYGDGDGKYFIPFSRSLDVVGHELTHGVVQHTAGLYYFFEPGALNEHLADVFGAVIKQWYLRQPVNTADWLIGADIVGPDFPGKALRTFKAEKAYSNDPQPKHYSKKYRGFSDNGGVHINSGYLNHAFYLFCMRLGGYSFDVPIKIWYSAMLRCGNFTGHKKFAKITLEECKKNYSMVDYQALKESWREVGINV